MRVHLSNLGCKLNQAELDRLAREFIASGHAIVNRLDEADLHVVNSCTVTHVAARDSRKIARRGRRVNPRIKTVLTGCYVNSSPGEAAALAGVDLLIPNERKEALVSEVERAFNTESVSPGLQASLDLPYMSMEFTNTRGLVKVEDGCNMPCAFCIIPSTRGPQRSRPLDEIVHEVKGLVVAGLQEIVVTGVQISSYRWRGKGLFDLVTELLEQTEVPRLRLTSIAPWQFDKRLFDLFETGRLCRHFHLSLQSGCSGTLRRMRRPYTAQAFAELASTIRASVPGTALTTDIIVGFPGETDEEFEESLSLTERIGFSKIHAFPYSPRPATEAAGMPDQLPHQVTKERMARMLAVAESSEKAFWDQQLGHEVEILWESKRNGTWMGMSDNYIRALSSREQERNVLTRATFSKALARGVEVSSDVTAIGRGLQDSPSQPLTRTPA